MMGRLASLVHKLVLVFPEGRWNSIPIGLCHLKMIDAIRVANWTHDSALMTVQISLEVSDVLGGVASVGVFCSEGRLPVTRSSHTLLSINLMW